MNLIGFTTKYYTLWDYSEEKQYIMDAYGKYHVSGIKQIYHYIKNISFDIDKVKALYPNVSIDEELRGKTNSWEKVKPLDLPTNIFWFGKYRGKLIEEILVSDFKYCLWAIMNSNQVNEFVSTHPVYLEYLDEKQREIDKILEESNLAKVGDTITINFDRNGYNADEDYSSCWSSGIFGDVSVNILCPGVKQVDGMYPYLMPVINGKAQRVKGKSINVTVTEVINTKVYDGQVSQCLKIA